MKVNWKIRGRVVLGQSALLDLFVKTEQATVAKKFTRDVPLQGVQVKVSAREKVAGVWGPFNSWDTVPTKSDGSFEVTKEKDKSDRQFKIEVLFKDDTLKIYPENDGLWSKLTDALADVSVITDLAEDALELVLEQTGRLAYDVKWFKILEEDKHDKDHGHGTVDFGDLSFSGGSANDLGDAIAIRHAAAWFIIKEVFGVIHSFSDALHFDNKKPVALKYPHDNPLIGDKIEAAYSNPYNEVIYVIRNSESDWFGVDTVMHELMHIWAYQHCTHEKAMAWQLLIHGGTHDTLQKKSFVAFHEGFAEWASNRLTTVIFGTTSKIYGDTPDTGVPFSRTFLGDQGIQGETDIDKSEYGWISLFNLLMTPYLEFYDFNSSGDYAAKRKMVSVPSGHVCSSPALSLEEVLSVFVEHKSKGHSKILNKNEMNLNDFLKRVADISDKMTGANVQMVKDLLNPSLTNDAVEVVCPAPSKQKIPPKNLEQPPITVH